MGLLDQLNKESKAKLAPPSEVVKIEISQLQGHPGNFFSMDEEELQALSEDIEVNGLNTCLRIRRLPEGHELYSKDKPYQILVGHRRFRAVASTSMKYVDCRIVECNENEAEKILITDNMTARKITPAEQLEAIKRLKELFKKEKEENNIPGRISHLIAKEVGLSKTQVGRYETVLNKASEKTLEAISEGNMGIKSAVELCNLNKNEQDEIINVYDDKEIEMSEIKKLVEEKKKNKNNPNKIANESGGKASEHGKVEDNFVEVDLIESVRFSTTIISKQVTNLEGLLHSYDYTYGVQIEIIKRAVKEIEKNLCNE